MKNHIYYQTVAPPRAALLIVHGMAEHQGRYAEFAQVLADQGIAVLTFDHLGHGKPAQASNTLGFMGNPQPAELMIGHVMQHADRLAAAYPDMPQFILGHSMGSFLTRCLLGRFGQCFDGAILVGTSTHNPLASLFLPMTKTANRLAPRSRNRVFEKILNSVNNVPFRHEPNLEGFNWLNSSPERIKEYLADPLCGFPFTNNGYYALMALMEEGTGEHWAKNIAKTLPMLFISGQDDPIGQMGKSIPKIVQNLNEQGFLHIAAKQYPGMRHEVLLEDDRQQVYQDILDWLASLES